MSDPRPPFVDVHQTFVDSEPDGTWAVCIRADGRRRVISRHDTRASAEAARLAVNTSGHQGAPPITADPARDDRQVGGRAGGGSGPSARAASSGSGRGHDAMTSTQPARRRDKQPGSPLSGSYGHPVHPILVTVPIGAWVASVVFDLASRWSDDGGAFADGAELLVAIGIVGGVLAALFGLLDYVRIQPGTPARRTATAHLLLNDLVLLAFFGSWAWRRSLDDDTSTPTGVIVLSAVALALLGVSGHLGGKLAYRFGVRVADEATQDADGFRRPVRSSDPPATTP